MRVGYRMKNVQREILHHMAYSTLSPKISRFAIIISYYLDSRLKQKRSCSRALKCFIMHAKYWCNRPIRSWDIVFTRIWPFLVIFGNFQKMKKNSTRVKLTYLESRLPWKNKKMGGRKNFVNFENLWKMSEKGLPPITSPVSRLKMGFLRISFPFLRKMWWVERWSSISFQRMQSWVMALV